MKGKTQKGITLIALIITIVVLLILAAVAISSITNDGILQYAQNSGSKYNQSVANEQQTLKEYTNYLENASSGNGDGNGSEGTTDTTYTIGDEVTVGSETFYVIKNSSATEEKVLLLAKECIDTTNLVQSASAGTVAFSTESYWGEGTSPYDIVEPETIPESHIAAKAAYDYGVKVGGTGRLMTYSEVESLSETDFSTKLYGTDFWLASADFSTIVWHVGTYDESQPANGVYSTHYTTNDAIGIRPVVEISKDLLS